MRESGGEEEENQGEEHVSVQQKFLVSNWSIFLLFLQLSELGDFATDVRSALLRSQGIIGLMRGWEEDKEG